MVREVNSFLPLATASTAPPPTLAVKERFSTSVWAAFMASCIWAICCWTAAWRWAPVAFILPLVNPRRALYPMVIFSFIL